MKRALFTLAVTAFAMASCLSVDVPTATNSGMCNVLSPTRLLSDEGIYFNLEGNGSAVIPDSFKRVMIDCDILDKLDDNEYSITIRDFAPVWIQETAVRSAAEQDALGNDCIDATSWIGGGFLNAAVTITGTKGSKTAHSINLEFDDIRSNKDTLYFRFRHNAYGESYDSPSAGVSDVEMLRSFHSFPFESFVPDNTDSIVLHIENEWFVTDNGNLTKERRELSGNLRYSRKEH